MKGKLFLQFFELKTLDLGKGSLSHFESFALGKYVG